MSSNTNDDHIDLERGLPTTPGDVAALRRLPRHPMTDDQYIAFLALFTTPYEQLAAKPGPRGEPFRLI